MSRPRQGLIKIFFTRTLFTFRQPRLASGVSVVGPFVHVKSDVPPTHPP